jgi:hypothetical protein
MDLSPDEAFGVNTRTLRRLAPGNHHAAQQTRSLFAAHDDHHRPRAEPSQAPNRLVDECTHEPGTRSEPQRAAACGMEFSDV